MHAGWSLSLRAIQHPDLCWVIFWSDSVWVDSFSSACCMQQDSGRPMLCPAFLGSVLEFTAEGQLQEQLGKKNAYFSSPGSMACMVTHFASLEGGQSHPRCWSQVFLPDNHQWNCQHQVVTDCRWNFFTPSICLLITLNHTLLFLTLLLATIRRVCRSQ